MTAVPVVVGRDLTRTFMVNQQSVAALRGVSIQVDQGEYLAFTGPSGSGKSTLLQLLGGLDTPTSGTLELLGRSLDGMSDAALTDLRLHRIGFVFQRFHLLPVLTAQENVELPMAEAGLGRAQRAAKARDLLEYVGLGARAGHRATQLSGGEMQRVAVARALANDPALLLADEPTGELDVETGNQVLDLFDRLHADGRTLIVVTHDERLASRARRRVRLRDGRVVADESMDQS
ncbi:MAG: ABC transporter ATP-binding protein [Gemmatimonadales bacterium]|nr:ABC transporter ATP-binding protein [Gemmatimonadales bacterium]